MIKGFVFGKFMPFHKGHEAMIQFALTQCDFLTVLVCCSDKEDVLPAKRAAWLETTFAEQPKIEVRIFNYIESELPNSSVSSEAISRIWADTFMEILPDYAVLVTSEPYGDFVAEFMNIRHIPFDFLRTIVPVSATDIRTDIFTNWHFLPKAVKADYVFKVVILGTESTGKTTLTSSLAAYFNCSYVLEAGRDIISDSTDFTFADLHLVAEEHACRIRETSSKHPLVIIDTDIYITKSYALFSFQQELEVADSICNANKAHLYLYLNNDVAFYQDGTRLNENDRNLLDMSHRAVLKEHQIDFVEIKGGWQERFEKAVELINERLSIRTG